MLQRELDDPGLYARDPKKFSEVSTRLAAAQAKLAEVEDKWLELELLRAEIGG